MASREVLEQRANDPREHPQVRVWVNWALRKLAAIQRVEIVTEKTPGVDISEDQLDPETGEVMVRGYEVMSRKVAERILQVVKEKEKTGKPALIMLPTGSTPEGLYKVLREKAGEKGGGGVDFSNVILFHLDEYIFDQDRFYDDAGKLKDTFQEQTYKHFMETHVVNPLKESANLNRFYTPIEHPEVLRRKAGESEAAYKERAAQVANDYEKKLTDAIEEAGGIDLVVLGIGGGYMEGGAIQGGHIAFNESSEKSNYDSKTRVAELSEKTRMDAQGRFGGLHATPHYAITVGMKRILEAKEVLMLGSGEDKAAVVEEALNGEISSNFPASFLRLREKVTYYLDRDAAVALPEMTKPWLFPDEDPKNRDWTDPGLVSKAVYYLLQVRHKTLGQLQRLDFVQNGFDDLLEHYKGRGGLQEIKKIAKERVARHFHNPKKGQDLLPSNATIVFFSPHPDDDVLTSGVTLQHLVEPNRGNNVHIGYLVAGHGSVWSPVLSPKGGLEDLKKRYKAEWKKYHKGEPFPSDAAFQSEFDNLTAIPIMKSLLERAELPKDLREDLKSRGLDEAWQSFKARSFPSETVTSWYYEDLEQEVESEKERDAVVRLWIYARMQKREEEAREAVKILGVDQENLKFFRLGYYSYRAKVHTGEKYQGPDYEKVLDWLRGLYKQAPGKEIHIFLSHEIDPHGAHGIGAKIIERAMKDLAKDGIQVTPWWYRGAYEEFPLEEDGSNVVVPASRGDFDKKKMSIWAHASQRVAMFPGLDRRQREFWERVFDRNERTGRLLDALEILDWAPAAAEVFSRQQPIRTPQTITSIPRAEVRSEDFSRRNFMELLHLLNRNLWIIQGRFSSDGTHHYEYHDKSALRFKGDEPDSDAIYGYGLYKSEFSDLKRIVGDIIRDRIGLGKLVDMRTQHPGDEMRVKLLAKQLGIPVEGLEEFPEEKFKPRSREFPLEKREKVVLTYLEQTAHLPSSLKEERELVAEMLLDQSPAVRAVGISVLKFLPNNIVEPILDLALTNSSPAVQKAGFEVIRDRGLKKYRSLLLATLYQGYKEWPSVEEREVYRTALEALGVLAAKDSQLYDLLLERFEWTLDTDLLFAFQAARIPDERLYRLILNFLGDTAVAYRGAYSWKIHYRIPPLLRIRAAETLRKLGFRTQEAIDILLPLLKSDEDDLLASAVYAVGEIAKDNRQVNQILSDLWQHFSHAKTSYGEKLKKTLIALAISRLKQGNFSPDEVGHLLYLASRAEALDFFYADEDIRRIKEEPGTLASFIEDHPGKIDKIDVLLPQIYAYRKSYGFWNIDTLRALPDFPLSAREEIINRFVEDLENRAKDPEKSIMDFDIRVLGRAGVSNEKVVTFLQRAYPLPGWNDRLTSAILLALSRIGRIEGSFNEGLIERVRVGKHDHNTLEALRLYLFSRFRGKSYEPNPILPESADSELEIIRIRKQVVYPLERSLLEASDRLAIFAVLPVAEGRIDFESSPHQTVTIEIDGLARHWELSSWENTTTHQVGSGKHFRGTLEGKTSVAEGFVRLDPPVSRPEFLAALGLPADTTDSVYEKVLAEKLIETIRILSVPGGIHPEKPLRIRDSVREIFQRQGYLLPQELTIQSFLQIVSAPPISSIKPIESKGVEIREGVEGTAQWIYEDEKELTSVTTPVGLAQGLHVAPVNEIVRIVSSPSYTSLSVSITKTGPQAKTADARQAAEILQLVAEKGNVITVTAHGGIRELRHEVLTKLLSVVAPEKKPASYPGPRAEVRESQDDKSELLKKVITPEIKILFEGPREQTLPLRFEEYGTDFLVKILTKLLKQPIYSEKAGILPPTVENRLAQYFGKSSVTPSVQFPHWVENTASDQGRVLLDSVWLERLMDKSPRALYILFTALQKFQRDHQAKEPLIAVAGDEEKLLKKIEEALLRKENGVKSEEKHLLTPHLKEIIDIVSPDQLSHYVEVHNYGVATLIPSGNTLLTKLPLGAQFMVDPSQVADVDLMAVAFLVPALLKAASLVSGKKNPAEQMRILQPYLQQIIPGATSSKGALGFVIHLAQYIQQVLINRHLVEVSA